MGIHLPQRFSTGNSAMDGACKNKKALEVQTAKNKTFSLKTVNRLKGLKGNMTLKNILLGFYPNGFLFST